MFCEVTIRDATDEDVPVTAAIIAAEAGGAVDEWRERFAQVLADSDRQFLVAEVDGQVVGFGHARHVQRDAADTDAPPSGWYLSGVTVAAAHRRSGVGLALTSARLDRLGQVPVYYVAAADNTATISLHQRLGFVDAGSITLPGGQGPLLLFRRPATDG